MSNTLRSVGSSVSFADSEFDQVQCLSGSSIGRYLSHELAHAPDLMDWFRSRVGQALNAAADGEDDEVGRLCLDLAGRIRLSGDVTEMGGEIADFLRDLATLPGTDRRHRAELLMHRCLRDLADRQVLMLLGKYPEGVRDDEPSEGPGN